jgi:plastocyanin
VLALPASAAAATKTVYAGFPPTIKQLAAKLGASAVGADQPDLNAFVNQRVAIHVGDKVAFLIRGFHTIDLPKRGGADVPLIIPSGGLASGINDAAGNPFWFNGHVPNLGFNPVLFKASGGKLYNGTARIDSGLPLGPPKPFVVSFSKPGTYKYYCDVHPGMVGYVTVKPKGARVPTAKQDAAAQLSQMTAAVRAAVAAAKAKLPADTVSVGKSGPGGIELFSMFPR